MTLRKMVTGALLAGAAFCGLASAAAAGEYDGITVHIMTRPGKVIAQRLIDRGVEFTAATGAKIEVAEVPFAELFQKVQTDWTTGPTPSTSASSRPAGPSNSRARADRKSVV